MDDSKGIGDNDVNSKFRDDNLMVFDSDCKSNKFSFVYRIMAVISQQDMIMRDRKGEGGLGDKNV